MIVIGSYAGIKHKCVPFRNPKDIDIISTEFEAEMFAKGFGIKDTRETDTGIIYFTERFPIEATLVEKSDHSARLYETIKKDIGKGMYASPEWLYFMKMSHRFKKNSPHFWKTARDIFYMRSLGVQMPVGSEELFKEREKLTYTNSLPKLNVRKSEFFKDEVYAKYSHDDIHVAVKLYEKPAYTYFLKDGEEVMCDKNKFFSISNDLRLASCCEEVITLVAERSLIPFDFKPDVEKMFFYSLSKVSTSITSGWFREYCYDNIPNVINFYEQNYKGRWVDKVKRGLVDGTIRKC